MHGPIQSRETVPLILTLFYTRGLGIVALHGSLTYIQYRYTYNICRKILVNVSKSTDAPKSTVLNKKS
jgi:hypothetical protein